MTNALLPWNAGPALYEVIRDWDGSSPCELPDEASGDAGQIRFAPGAWDGILGHHVSGLDEQEEARLIARLVAALDRLIARDDDASRVHLYDLLQGESLIRHIDLFLRELTEQDRVGPAEVRPHALWLVRHAAHRNPLKFGLALLGVSGSIDDLDDLRTLASHDEFTLYAAVAAANLVEDPVEEWWSMARRVNGWGKVHLVERLCQRAEGNEPLRAWLVRSGCANEVMPEYLALDCAMAGGLAEQLATPDPDDELIDGASVIVVALLSPYTPGGTIDSYPEAVEAIQSLVDHLEQHCDTLSRLSVVNQLATWFVGSEDDWEERAEMGWTEAIREELADQAQRILDRPQWRGRIREAFANDPARRTLAWDLSLALGIDLWEDAFAQLKRKPDDSWLYSILGVGDDAERLRRVVAFAERTVSWTPIATGPGDLLGIGPAFGLHACLDALLQHMQRPGVFSVPIVAAALRSPVVRNRHLAAAALEAHLGQLHQPAIRASLALTAEDEVNEELRQKWRTLIEQTISEEDDLLEE
jgi:hypothetical protein